MLDIAKVIVEYWKERNSIVVVEETSEILIYKNGVYVPFTTAQIKNWINAYLDEPLDSEVKDEEFLNVKFTTTLLHQVKNRLHKDIIKLKEFENNPYRITLLNGWVDLKDGQFYEHTPFDLFPYKTRIQIPVYYEKETTCPAINKFLIEVFGADRVAFIYEILGYLLFRSIKLQKAFIFFGEAGSGKTSFIEMLRAFLGAKNIQDISIQDINRRYQMGNIRNKLANIFDELPIKKIGYIQNFKQIVTNKTLTSEIKFVQDLVTWNNFCKQIYTCNKLPKIGENTGDDFWRRIILIHCTNFFNNGIKDFDIGDKITTKEEFSGLLNCAIFHFKHLINRQHFLDRFDNIDTVKGIWQINISPLKLFLDTNCTLNENEREEVTNFRRQVNAFRKERNALPISQNLISRKLKDLGIPLPIKKGDQKRYYIGIKLTKTIIEKIDLILLGGQTVL